MNFAPEEGNRVLKLLGVFDEFILAASGSFLDLQYLATFVLNASAQVPDIGRIASLFGVEHVPHVLEELRGIEVRRRGGTHEKSITPVPRNVLAIT